MIVTRDDLIIVADPSRLPHGPTVRRLSMLLVNCTCSADAPHVQYRATVRVCSLWPRQTTENPKVLKAHHIQSRTGHTRLIWILFLKRGAPPTRTATQALNGSSSLVELDQ